MSLIPDQIQRPEPTVAQGAVQVRQALRMAVMNCRQACLRVQRLVETHGRTALATELGDDAAELATAYSAVRQLATTYMTDPGPLPE